ETANDFAADVTRYLTDQPVEACPPSAWYRFGKLARRNRVALMTSAAVATALVLGTAVSTWMAVRATRAERTARAEADKAAAINKSLADARAVQADREKNNVADRVTLREVLDRAAEKVSTRFRGQPLLEAALRSTISDVYHSLSTSTASTESRKQAAT